MSRRQRVIGRVVLLTDISEERKAQSTLHLQSTALSAAQNGIVITDRNGIIQWANPAFSALTGYPLEEVVGQNPKLLKSGHHDAEFYQALWSAILRGQVWRGEVVNRRKDGSLYSEEMTITPLVQADGSITHFIAIKQDITLRKQAEAALKQAHDEAVQANRLKTQLLANVSHDLRTPLGAIIGYAEMLQSGVFGQQGDGQRQANGEILDSANQLLAFINNLIGQAQLETGRVILHSRPFEPGRIVEDVFASVRYHAEKKGLELRCEIDPGLPNPLTGDDYWLKQIVLNLVNNAVKFTDHGAVTTRLFSPAQGQWAIQVADTGIGIPPEHQEMIFSPFQQVDGSPTRRRGGSGLGLSIVKQLAETMGGRVSVESRPGQGATFTVVLPIRASQE
jgi:PAS domain S-box-containing protein